MTSQLLTSLFLEVRPALLRFLRARGAATDEAEDLLQDLFLKLEAFPPGTINEPRAYLYRMADNLFLDRVRSAHRRSRREEAWLDQSRNDGTRSTLDATDDVFVARERLRLVGLALATLPERTVDVFRRFRIEGERQKVIAVDLGISVSAVEKHLQRAYAVVLGVKIRSDAENDLPRRLKVESEPDVE